MKHTISWFEIPVTDFERARTFYGAMVQGELFTQQMGDFLMGFFPMEEGAVGGAIIQGEGCVPTTEGTMVYFDAGDDLSDMLARVEKAGGKVLIPKTLITDEIGFFAVFMDTEGNRVAMHSRH